MIFRKAILIIHGFGGGTYDLEYLANKLELVNHFDVYTFTLPGHDNNLEKIKMETWIKSAEDMTEMLINEGYKNIYVIGHSMGGIIATHIAGKYKQVKKLVLAAPAFHFFSFKGNKIDFIESFKNGKDALKEYKTDQVLTRFINMPSNAVKEFIRLTKEYYDTPFSITIPTLIIEGTKDIVVPKSSTDYVYDHIKSKQKLYLMVKDINHAIYRSHRKEEVTNKTINFLKSKNKNNYAKKEEI